MQLTGEKKFNSLVESHKVIWMGIVNLTPDSFSDGGLYLKEENALNRAIKMVDAGAQILDFGGASTRPNSEEVSFEEEYKRVFSTLKKARQIFSDRILLSADTYSPKLAEALAQEDLIDIINDVYCGAKIEKQKSTIDIAAQYKLAYVVMHMQGKPIDMQISPNYSDCVYEILNYFKDKIKIIKDKGVTYFALDPGIGFGKSLQNNLDLLSSSAIKAMVALKYPVLIGLSRKSFLQKLHPEFIEPFTRDQISKEYEFNCIEYGAKIIRTHTMPQEINFERK